MEAELIQLLTFADEAIGRYITFYMTGMAALAILVMSEGYKNKFKTLGKVVLSFALMGLAFGDWHTLVYYHQIYNQTVIALQDSVVGLDHLFGPDNGALQPKDMWHVHGGHIMGGVIGLLLVWWLELQTWNKTRKLNRQNRRRHAGKN
jgi:membrane associated rhomboid family serine protease